MSNVVSIQPPNPREKLDTIHEHFLDVLQRLSLSSHVLCESNAFEARELETRAAIQLHKAVTEMDRIWVALDELGIMLRPKAEVSNG
jgi:hypothetical protein